MITKRIAYLIASFIIGISLIIISCDKDNNKIPILSLPVLETITVIDITQTTATCGGNIISNGGSAITERGVCWSTENKPTVADSKTTDSTGIGDFYSNITGLIHNTTYYVRAYATNSDGTGYGKIVSFTTQPGKVPTLETSTVSDITQTTATCGGYAVNDRGWPISAKGVCWSTRQNPIVDDSKTTDGTDEGQFTSNITGLKPNTTYYIRAYATNIVGTGYGSAKLFVTKQGIGESVTDIVGNIYNIVNIGTQTWMKENLKTTKYNDNTAITYYPEASDWKANYSEGAYVWYDNDTVSNKNIYGALYNWFTVSSDKVCPTGWHVPSKEEWTILIDYISGPSGPGGNMKDTGTIYWLSPNRNATNSSGFSALPGGYRVRDGTFKDKRGYAYFRSSTYGSSAPYFCFLYYNNGSAGVWDLSTNGEDCGMSIRCVKD